MDGRLFPLDLSERQWAGFAAHGYSDPVAGTIHRGSNPPACGMPLGGIDTGCLDLEVRGLLGYSTIFNSLVPRRGPLNLPFLGLSVDNRVWALTTMNMSWREGSTWNDPYESNHYEAVRTAKNIHYWGHYPVADMEFVTDAPVQVGMRAWSPFIPGDVDASNTPGAIFEIHVRNESDEPHKGTLVFSFPGPSEEEAGTVSFDRQLIFGSLNGVIVSSDHASYALGIIGDRQDGFGRQDAVVGAESIRMGGDLGTDGEAWSTIQHRLPHVRQGGGTSLALDYHLKPKQNLVIRYVLAWYSPVWKGGGTMTAGGNSYRHMYARRYDNVQRVARYLTENHERLLSRIIAWQTAIYGAVRKDGTPYPLWLRDALVNILHLITETSVWAQAENPIGSWCRTSDGVFGMNESPRWCPQIECIPCNFYGNIPLIYFFPELIYSTMRAMKEYQFKSGAAPWVFGGVTGNTMPYEMAIPSRGYVKKPQTTLDGVCYTSQIYRMWRVTGDDGILTEFYDSVKKNTIFTMNLNTAPNGVGVVSMPTNNFAQDWYESCDLFGIVPHIGGAHLAQLRMAKHMAHQVGDEDFSRKCSEWLRLGSQAMEEKTWAGTHYMLYHESATGKRSNIVMAYQLDGEWIARFHGLEGVFDYEHVKRTLSTIRRTCTTVTNAGAATFSAPDGTQIDPDVWNPGYWGTEGVHPPGTFMLAMTYMYLGPKEFGIELSRRTVHEVLERGWYWDWPVVINGTEPRIGADYYQNLMLWALPAALDEEDIAGPVSPDGLVSQVLAAGQSITG